VPAGLPRVQIDAMHTKPMGMQHSPVLQPKQIRGLEWPRLALQEVSPQPAEVHASSGWKIAKTRRREKTVLSRLRFGEDCLYGMSSREPEFLSV
jgi:hypothetical protein